jgi:hypothetical protein
MTRYAGRTTVTPERSKAEIESALKRYGADQLVTGWSADGRVLISFTLKGKAIKFTDQMPPSNAFASDAKHQQAIRQRWRAITLYLKAQLEWIENSGRPVEEVFFPHLLLPSGATVVEENLPILRQALEQHKVPRLLEELR